MNKLVRRLFSLDAVEISRLRFWEVETDMTSGDQSILMSVKERSWFKLALNHAGKLNGNE